jgi:hypothetical protein
MRHVGEIRTGKNVQQVVLRALQYAKSEPKVRIDHFRCDLDGSNESRNRDPSIAGLRERLPRNILSLKTCQMFALQTIGRRSSLLL